MNTTQTNIPKPIAPGNPDSLGVLGYLIVLNNQVHSYEMKVLEKYLKDINTTLEDTCLNAIINGSEDAVPYDTALEAFKTESAEVKLGMLYCMYVLSYVDNHFDDIEEKFINEIITTMDFTGSSTAQEAEAAPSLSALKATAIEEARTLRSENNAIFTRNQAPGEKSLWQKIIAWLQSLIAALTGKKTADQLRSGEYRDVINRCSEIAIDDLAVVEPAYNKVLQASTNAIKDIENYKKDITTKSEDSQLSAATADTIGKFVDLLNTDVVEQTKRQQAALEQKKRTISDFTISLIGRTKAGKSTLHTILTQQGKERIGVGKQRTTRYNWVYQWNLLRIIDTPGIGSAEAAGRKDEEIAESVLGESDIICFVVADDSILKDILEFIEKIALLNKPVIILLNHKENIRPGVKFRRFINNPKQWLEDGGESSLKGHENRIRKYADDHGFGKLVNVYPVFLLPALMSEEPEYKEHRDLLWESSNVGNFIDRISDWVLHSGMIKRSQTILDETAHVFEQAEAKIAESQTLIENQIKFLEKEKSEKLPDLHDTLEGTLDNIGCLLEDSFNDLANNKALEFAEEYIGRGSKIGDDLDEKWTEYVERIGFEKNLESEIGNVLAIYQEKADRTIRELFEDILYSVNLSLKMRSIEIPSQFDLKSFTGVISGGLGVASAIVFALGVSTPVGWILAIAGAIGGLLSGQLKTKKTRRQEAIDMVAETVRKAINEQTPEQVKAISDDIAKGLRENEASVIALFNDLQKGLTWTEEKSRKLIDEYSSEVDKINRTYAWRILQFLEQGKELPGDADPDKEILSVDRSDKDRIVIETASDHEVDTNVLKAVLAEEVIITRRA